MRFRKLKIAWSIGSGIVFVLLLTLWMRSYGTWDRCFCTGLGRGWQINSMLGQVVLSVAAPPKESIPFLCESLPTKGRFQGSFDAYVLGFYFRTNPSLRLSVPFWFVVALTLSVASAPWLWRFSLRTLVIFMSMFAIVLATDTYMKKQAS